MQNPNSGSYISWEYALFIAEKMIVRGYSKTEYSKQPKIIKGAIKYLRQTKR